MKGILFALIFSLIMSINGGRGVIGEGPDGMEIGADMQDMPEFSDDTLFTLREYEPWIYESLHYTLKSDGTLIVLYYNTELGREVLSDERMNKIKAFFSPEKVYKMNPGKEDDRTDGTSRYIILYDAYGNEIKIGGYELTGGDGFNHYFDSLYQLLEDEYTKQFSDKLDECARDGITYRDRYLTGADDK